MAQFSRPTGFRRRAYPCCWATLTDGETFGGVMTPGERCACGTKRIRPERHAAAPLLAPWQRHQAFDVCRLPDGDVRFTGHGHRDHVTARLRPAP